MSTAKIELRDVVLTLGDGEETVTALDQVNLSVGAGELVAILGPSGSGKSSLLAVAGGLTTPTSGTVTVADQSLTGRSRRELTRLRRELIGFVFQSGNLLPSLTAADQLRLPGTFNGRRSKRDPLALLAEVGLAEKADRRPHQLSGGERQRVGIARALITDPAVLLVDEPTAALDRARSHEIVKLLAEETHQHQIATIMVTHDHDVLDYCDRVLVMEDGKLREQEG